MKWMVSTFGGNQSGTWYLYIRSCHLQVIAQIGQFKSLCCWSLNGKKTAPTLVSTFPSLFLSQVTFKRVFRECRHLSPCSSCPKSWQVLASCGKNAKPANFARWPTLCRSSTQVKYVKYSSTFIFTCFHRIFLQQYYHFHFQFRAFLKWDSQFHFRSGVPGSILHNQLRIYSEKARS